MGLLRYENFLTGLEKLKPFVVEFNLYPIPKSFPNGSADFSTQAYCGVTCDGLAIWEHIEKNPDFTNQMGLLGWQSEDEDCQWVYRSN